MNQKLGILVLLLLALALVACGGETASPTEEVAPAAGDTPAAQTEPVEEPEATEGEIAGRLLIWVQQANQDVFEETVLDEFQAQYPDVTIEWVNYPPDEVANQLQVAIQGGTGAPDLAVTEHRSIPRLVELGGLVDLTSQLEPYMANLNAAALDSGSKDGEYYSVPWDVGPVMTFYRRDIFEAAGLASAPEEVSELIGTWDEFLDVCIQIKEETGANCFALNKANNYGDVYFNMLWQQGLGFVDDEGNIAVDSPKHVATLETLAQFWEADVVSDELEWNDGWYAELNASLDAPAVTPVATVTIGSWMGNFLEDWVAADQAGNWGVVPMPAMEAGGVRAANQGGSAFIIPEQSTNKEAAWVFAEFMVLNADNHLAIYEYSDYFPALETVYDAPLFSEPQSYFGDQVGRETVAAVAPQVPEANIYVAENATITGALQTAIQKVGTGAADPAAALEEAAETARLETGLD
ncbi:MAG: sugar ABC transporter substrate-binding protein [Anaerolineae bacterium]|nr:sugar ABC transporter substrate-binding protein [Anaerolineae bacterium]